jgi:hypothetical protein
VHASTHDSGDVEKDHQREPEDYRYHRKDPPRDASSAATFVRFHRRDGTDRPAPCETPWARIFSIVTASICIPLRGDSAQHESTYS